VAFLRSKERRIILKKWQYALIVFLGGCCYGILSTFVKLAYSAGFSSTEVTGGQYFGGTVLIWCVALFTKKKKLSLKQTIKLVLSGIPFGLTGLFYYQSLKTLNASLAIIFLFQFVWIGAIFDWIFNKKKPSKQKLISICIVLIGSVLAANVISQKEGIFSWQGAIWGLLASFTYTGFIFLSSSVEKNTPPVLKSALLSTGALIVVFLLFPPKFLFDFSVIKGLTQYGLILGLFGVVFPPILFSIGMPHVGPGLGTILSASELPVAVTLSSLVLSEHVNWMQWIGVILIFVAIIGCNIRSEKNDRELSNDIQETQYEIARECVSSFDKIL
jgi:drug/metabolite transporter (DMT)-like permease